MIKLFLLIVQKITGKIITNLCDRCVM